MIAFKGLRRKPLQALWTCGQLEKAAIVRSAHLI
jgi:hypothetical protein